jgi:hypothetical protein
MNNREVAHLWNAQSRPRAKGSHFFFEGPTIYSYGPHFPVATIHTRKSGSLVLFNERTCSVTTARHQNLAHRACSNRYSVTVPHIAPRSTDEHAVNLAALAARQAAALDKARRRQAVRIVQLDQRSATQARNDYARYCLFFGIKRKPLPTLEGEFNAALDRARRIENPDPASADKRERARAQRIERNRERDEYMDAHRANLARGKFYTRMALRTDWRLHGAFTGYNAGASRGDSDPIMLRVNGEKIETSHGARVPLAAAPMVWLMVQRARQGRDHAEHARKAYGRQVRIGDYPLDRIDADGTLHVGCHVIPYSELATMARTLGLA